MTEKPMWNLGAASMTPSVDDYRSYAQECLRWADESDNEEHRQAFFEMAKVRTQLALHGNEAQGPQMSVAAK